MVDRRLRRNRSDEERAAQTEKAHKYTEDRYATPWIWIRALFIEGMQRQHWSSRAQAARWLTQESDEMDAIFKEEIRKEKERRKDPRHEKHNEDLDWDIEKFMPSSDASRGYSMHLYRKLGCWERDLEIPYRIAGVEPACPEEDTFSLFEHPPREYHSEKKGNKS